MLPPTDQVGKAGQKRCRSGRGISDCAMGCCLPHVRDCGSFLSSNWSFRIVAHYFRTGVMTQTSCHTPQIADVFGLEELLANPSSSDACHL